MKKDLNNLIKMVEKLSDSERKSLIDNIIGMMGSANLNNSESKSASCNKLIKEHRNLIGNPNCPHCNANANLGCIIKRGYVKGIQRYYCKVCNHTFVASTNTAFERSRKDSALWCKFIELTITGASLKKCAEECNIAYQTAFTWRHKILNCFVIQQENSKMSGNIQVDEMLLPISYKGNHIKGSFGEKRCKTDCYDNGLPRKSFRRGTDNKSCSSKDKACVFCMVKNGNEGFYAGVPGVGFMNPDMLQNTIGKHVVKESALILADQYKITRTYLEDNNYSHLILAANTSDNSHDHKPEIKGDCHLQHVNAMHMQLRRFLRKYCGVSSKYLGNYMALYVWLKNATVNKQKRNLTRVSISRVANPDCYISRKSIETKPAIPMCA